MIGQKLFRKIPLIVNIVFRITPIPRSISQQQNYSYSDAKNSGRKNGIIR
jgi:hypothetical protein